MKTTAVRIHGVNDLRMDTFELPEMKEDEILARTITDALCLSTYKVSQKGSAHKKLPDHLDETPIMMGHEFCGIIEKVGEKWKDKYKPGDKFVAQPNLGRADTFSLGYSFPYAGGDSTHCIIMNEAIEKGCLLPYHGDTFFEGAVAEPLSCVVAGFKANFHLRDRNDYDYVNGIKVGGNMVIMGGTGPMGMLAVDMAVHGDRRPGLLVVAGRTQEKLDRLKELYPEAEAAQNGVKLVYFNTTGYEDFSVPMREIAPGGFDDVFVMVADEKVVNQSEKLLGWDGCLNFFAGPIDSGFTAPINFYNIHYNATHYVGTSGSNTQDMIDALALIEKKVISPGKIITHIMGLNAVSETILNFPNVPGGKKISYSGKRYPISAVENIGKNVDNCEKSADLSTNGQENCGKFEEELGAIVEKNGGIWTREAEEYFLENAPDIE